MHRWDPRLKLIGLLLLAFTFSFVSNLRVLPVIIVLTLNVVAVSRYPLDILLRRLRYPLVVILGLIVLLSLISGFTPVVEWGGLTASPGKGSRPRCSWPPAFSASPLWRRSYWVPTPLLRTIKAMQALGLPYVMADMALLVIRYLEVLSADLRRMRISMRLRGHVEQRWPWRNLSTLA